MSTLFPAGAGPLLWPLLATLPVMTSIQISQMLSSGGRRPPVSATPRSASVRRLIKALNLHPLTISATIELTANELPRLMVVREVSEDEVDSITDWINEDRIRTVEQTYTLQSEADQ
jgi:predicted nuclease with RNAse H fold